jgi:hypothetical protein
VAVLFPAVVARAAKGGHTTGGGTERVSGGVSHVRAKGRETAIARLLVQRSTIELFDAYAVAIAPMPVEAAGGRPFVRPNDHLMGTVQVVAPGRRGVLTFSTSPAILVRTRPAVSDPHGQLDWMRELTNQLAGRIKSKFARYQLSLQMSLPSALSSTMLERNQVVSPARGTDLAFVFHAIRDVVLVTLTGGFDDTGLALMTDAPVADEGDVILF